MSGTIALSIGVALFLLLLVAILAFLTRVGFELDGLAYSFALVISGWAAYERFRATFHGLCERWSDEPVPLRIRGGRARRNVVRTT
jgi:hypothetical protein